MSTTIADKPSTNSFGSKMRSVIGRWARVGRDNDLFWKHCLNLQPSIKYRFRQKAALDPTSNKILDSLNENGIAVAHINDLPGGSDAFDRLQKAVDALLTESGDKFNDRSRVDLNAPIGTKPFNKEMLGSEVDFDPESVFAQFALQESLLNIANAYFGMYVKLRYYNVWHTRASEAPARESQLWHFDREDNFILKAFLYMRDVNEGSGPFTYAPRTHRRGDHWGSEPKYFMEGNVRRSRDEDMDGVVPKDEWIIGTGIKGTIIFADTRGFHKGGDAREGDRLMYTCMYTSPASDSKRLLKVPDLDKLKSQLTKAQLQAVAPF
jgi:hypothetical protein